MDMVNELSLSFRRMFNEKLNFEIALKKEKSKFIKNSIQNRSISKSLPNDDLYSYMSREYKDQIGKINKLSD